MLKSRRFAQIKFTLLAGLLLLLTSCQGYATPGGGYAFDVSIRIDPPAYPTLTRTITPLPTATVTFATNTPVFTATYTDEPTPTVETQVFPTWVMTHITNTTSSNWNIREEPSAASEDLGDLKPGESLEYQFTVYEGNGWYGVSWEGETAFVSMACCVDNG